MQVDLEKIMSKEIPVKEAEMLAKKYGYEQVIILAQRDHKTKKDFIEGWRTTYNTFKSKCKFLSKIADILAYNFRCFYCDEKKTEEYYEKILSIEKEQNKE